MFAVALKADLTKPLQISPGLSNEWCRGDIYNLFNPHLRGVLISGTICYDEGVVAGMKDSSPLTVDTRNYSMADCVVILFEIFDHHLPLDDQPRWSTYTTSPPH